MGFPKRGKASKGHGPLTIQGVIRKMGQIIAPKTAGIMSPEGKTGKSGQLQSPYLGLHIAVVALNISAPKCGISLGAGCHTPYPYKGSFASFKIAVPPFLHQRFGN